MLRILFQLPWFHANGHKICCQLKWSGRYIGTGRRVGEVMEIIWAPMKPVSGKIRYFSADRRLDLLTLIFYKYNDEHERTLSTSLPNSFILAVRKILDAEKITEKIVGEVMQDFKLDRVAAILRLDTDVAALTRAQLSSADSIKLSWKDDFAKLVILDAFRRSGLLRVDQISRRALFSGVSNSVTLELAALLDGHADELISLGWGALGGPAKKICIDSLEILKMDSFRIAYSSMLPRFLSLVKTEAEGLLCEVCVLDAALKSINQTFTSEPTDKLRTRRRQAYVSFSKAVQKYVAWLSARLLNFTDLLNTPDWKSWRSRAPILERELLSAMKDETQDNLPWPPIEGGDTASGVPKYNTSLAKYRHSSTETKRSIEHLPILCTEVKRIVNFYGHVDQLIDNKLNLHKESCSFCKDHMFSCPNGDIIVLQQRKCFVQKQKKYFDADKLKNNRDIVTQLLGSLEKMKLGDDVKNLIRSTAMKHVI